MTTKSKLSMDTNESLDVDEIGGVTVKARPDLITGPKVRECGFHCPQGWRHHEEFFAPHDKGRVGRGCE